MKKLILLTAFAFSLSILDSQAQQITKLWEANENLPTPESVLYDGKSNILYVSLIDGDGSKKDGKGGVALLNTDGTIKNANWVTGLDAPKGLALYIDLLYVADIDKVIVIDVISANVINEIEIKGSIFLNDVAVDANGVVYISDTRENKIYELKNNKHSIYKENVPSVNGLRVIDGSLYALAGPELWKFDANKNVQVIAKGFEKGGDGLEPVGNGDFLVSCWPGLIYYVKSDGTFVKMQDVQGQMNTADLGYNPKDKILYIPTFNNNSVIAYQLK